MANTSATEISSVLHAVSMRARASEQDLSAAIGMVSALSCLISGSTTTDIRFARDEVAAVRDELNGEHGVFSPQNALTGSQSHSYLAGALWATNEIMSARLESLAALPLPGGRTRRGKVKELVLSALAAGQVLSPTAVLDSIAQVDPSSRLDEISRGLSELLGDGLVASVSAEPNVDRRRKYFVITADGQRAVARKAEDYAWKQPGV